MKRFINYCTLSALCLLTFSAKSQTTVTIYPTKDAAVAELSPTSNFATYQYMRNLIATYSGVPHKVRSLIEFDLSSIPSDAIVTSATLFLYGENHLHYDKSTESYLERIDTAWADTTVTWNNQPGVSSTKGKVTLAAATNANLDYEVDMKDQVQDMIDDPSNNFGFLFRLASEADPYARLQFASSDHATSSKHPKLQITYYRPMQLSVDIQQIDPYLGTLGTADVSVQEGLPPYTFSWSNSTTNEDLEVTEPGTFSVTITDSDSNQIDTTIDIGALVEWKDVEGAYLVHGGLFKVDSTAWGNAGGASLGSLAAGEDGYVEYQRSLHGEILFMLGLSDGNTDAHYNTIDYGMYVFSSTQLQIYENGTYIGAYNNLDHGDRFRVMRSGSNILYMHNDDTLRTVSTDTNKVLNVDATIFNQNFQFSHVRTSFGGDNLVTITPTVQDYNPYTNALGSISLAVQGNYPPYKYYWDNEQSTSSISNLGVGYYTVTVTDSLGHQATKKIKVGSIVDTNATPYDTVEWVVVKGATESNGNLTMTAATGWGNAGAVSTKLLAPDMDGSVRYIKVANEDLFMFGLTEENEDEDYKTIDYAFYPYDAGSGSVTLWIYESGTFIADYGDISTDDTLIIKREEDSIRYVKNGTVLRSVATDKSKTLMADISMHLSGSTMSGLRIAFPGIPIIRITDDLVFPTNDNGGSLGSINTLAQGGQPPYTYFWNTGEVSSSIDGVSSGKYSLTVTDNAQQQFTKAFSLMSNVQWNDIVGATYTNGEFTKTAVDGWGNGGAFSEDVLEANQDGFVLYSKEVLGGEWDVTFGLSAENTDDHYNTIDYGFLVAEPHLVSIYENGVRSYFDHGDIQKGQTLSIHREGSNIIYKKDDEILKITPTDPSLELHADIALGEQNGKFSNVFVSFGGIRQSNYGVLQKKLDGGFYFTNYNSTAGAYTMNVYYKEDYYHNSDNLSYKVYDDENNVVTGLATFTKSTADNWYELSVSSLAINKYYVLEVTNDKGEQSYLRFKRDISPSAGVVQPDNNLN